MKIIATNPRMLIWILVTYAVAVLPITAAAQPKQITSKLLSELKFRCIGPAVTGGRIHDVEALPKDPSTIYVATASGGIWKSSNKGTTWRARDRVRQV